MYEFIHIRGRDPHGVSSNPSLWSRGKFPTVSIWTNLTGLSIAKYDLLYQGLSFLINGHDIVILIAKAEEPTSHVILSFLHIRRCGDKPPRETSATHFKVLSQ